MPGHQVIGVPDKSLGEKMISALRHSEIKHALVVHGLNGMDELSINGRSLIWEIKDGEIIGFNRKVSPEEVGLKRATARHLTGGTAQENSDILRRILGGEPGPRRDVVMLNAAAALLAGDKVCNLSEGVHLANESINSGSALAKLEQLINISQQLAGRTA